MSKFCCLKKSFPFIRIFFFFSHWRWNMSLSYEKGRTLISVNFSKFKNMWEIFFAYVVNFSFPHAYIRLVCWLRFIFSLFSFYIYFLSSEWVVQFSISFCWEWGYWLFLLFPFMQKKRSIFLGILSGDRAGRMTL